MRRGIILADALIVAIDSHGRTHTISCDSPESAEWLAPALREYMQEPIERASQWTAPAPEEARHAGEPDPREDIAEALDDLIMSKGVVLDEKRLEWLTRWVNQRLNEERQLRRQMYEEGVAHGHEGSGQVEPPRAVDAPLPATPAPADEVPDRWYP